MDKFVYFLTYEHLPYCGDKKVPIHASDIRDLPSVTSLIEKCPKLDPDRFGVEKMGATRFQKMRWPK